jgi:hypothetical protein
MKVSISEILSAVVFLPPGKSTITNFARQTAKAFFKSIGKLLTMIL